MPDRCPPAGSADGVIYGMGFSRYRAHRSTLIGNAPADIAMGRTDKNPLEGMALHAGKPWFRPMVGAYYRFKDGLA
jgi:hypothetical protein